MEKLTVQIAVMYWGCKVLHESKGTHTPNAISNNSFRVDDPMMEDHWMQMSFCKLILTPLSEITGEDAIEVGKLVGLTDECKVKRGEAFRIVLQENEYQFQISYSGYMCMRKHGQLYNCNVIPAINYLRSRSYDCDSLIEQGIAITLSLKTKK